jgi:hypothetical protein
MADLLAELEGLLDADSLAKIRSNPTVSERFTRASDVMSFYDGETNDPPPAPTRREAPPASGVPTGGGDLAALTAQLTGITSKLDGLDTTIKSKVDEVVQQRGNELVNNAIAISMRNNRELAKVDARHHRDFGEDLDDTALEAHVKAAQEAGRPFRTITDAYEDMTRERRVKKEVDSTVETRVREELKTRASGNVPGVTNPSASPMLNVLKGGGRKDGDAGTHIDKAASALRERLAERGEQVA